MKIQVNCRHCLQEFLKDSTQVKLSPNHFCSRSCAAKCNNKIYKKRKPEGICKVCGDPTHSAYAYCKDHRIPKNKPLTDYSKVTIEEMTKRGGSNKFDSIRKHARKILDPTSCTACNYSKHVETCHIKALTDWDPKTPINTVNDISNLIALCPNCHWEFDHGFLILEPITIKAPVLEPPQ